MNIEQLFDEKIIEITEKLDFEKLKLLLELEIAYEKESPKCIDDVGNIVLKSGGKPLVINIQNKNNVELFVYNNKIKIAITPSGKPRSIEQIINMLRDKCWITVYSAAKSQTSKYVDEYVFGIEFMDKNHLDMFKIMDELILTVLDGRFKDIKSLAEKLYVHTRDVHFKQEEEVMKSTKYNKYYPEDYKRHIEWHKDFLDALKELMKNAEKEKFADLIENLLIIFETYFEKYLKDTDARLAEYLKAISYR